MLAFQFVCNCLPLSIFDTSSCCAFPAFMTKRKYSIKAFSVENISTLCDKDDDLISEHHALTCKGVFTARTCTVAQIFELHSLLFTELSRFLNIVCRETALESKYSMLIVLLLIYLLCFRGTIHMLEYLIKLSDDTRCKVLMH